MNNEEDVLTKQERLLLLKEIRSAVYGIVKTIFDDFDLFINMYTYKNKDDVKVAKVSKLRMQLKALRAAKLKTLENIGKAHEEKIQKEIDNE